jgi:hypothetical protein
MRTLVK